MGAEREWSVTGGGDDRGAPQVDEIGVRGLLIDIETIHLDRGHDFERVREHCRTRGLSDIVCANPRACKPQSSISVPIITVR